MPGFLETTLYQGYDFASPYLEKAHPYVEKARNNVPLIDPALKKAEELVPILITRADQIAEPHVTKMRPYVEPRVEQVKEKVTPYVDEGVKKYGVLREEGVKYYTVGLDKVGQVKGFKESTETQIKEFKEARVSQIKEFTDPKVEKIRGFTEPKVEKIRGFKDARVTQIKEFAEPKVAKIKSAMEPRLVGITARRQKMQKLLRVPASLDVQGLNCETLLGKVASGLEKVEELVDQYAPLTEEQKKDNDSDVSSASATSCHRINNSFESIRSRLFGVFMLKISMLLSFPGQLKALFVDGTLKAKICVKAKELSTQATEKLAPWVTCLKKTSLFQKVAQIAVIGSEKMLGKEKTTSILSKAETYIPAAWKAAPPPSAKKIR